MKISAISTRERATIIRDLKQFGNWEATRKGWHIRMYRDDRYAQLALPFEDEPPVHYAAGLESFNVHGACRTVGAAVDEINVLIAGRPERISLLAPLAGFPFQRAVQEYRLPYKD